MDRPAAIKKSAFGKIRRRIFEERAGRGRQFRDARTTVAFQKERGRAAGCVIAAMLLGFDDERFADGRDFRAEARSGDPAADDDDVEKLAHCPGRLRIRKARRLVVHPMINGSFTEILLAGLAAILVVAAVIDFRTFTISNRLNLTVALLAPVYWASVAL